jgi:hypothetical protein
MSDALPPSEAVAEHKTLNFKSSAVSIRFAKACRMPHHAVLRSIRRAAWGETRYEAAVKSGAAFSNESGGN